MSIVEYLDTHSGSLTFLVTALYVVATIFICWANIRSANASKEQVKEMRRQFYAVNRPKITPTIEYVNRTFWALHFTNCGTQTAYNVSIELDNGFIDSITELNFKNQLIKNNGRICTIGVNQHYDLFIGSNAYGDAPNKLPAKGIIRYNGYNSSIYVENFEIDINKYAIFFSVDSFEDKLLKSTDKQTGELNRIADNLEEIALNSKIIEGKDNG